MNKQKDMGKANIRANENHAVLEKLGLTFCRLKKLLRCEQELIERFHVYSGLYSEERAMCNTGWSDNWA